MNGLAQGKGMKSVVLNTATGITKNVTKLITQAANELVSGDFFFLTYSGHGGQQGASSLLFFIIFTSTNHLLFCLADINGDEKDKIDETWCLYDGQLVDDKLTELLSLFKAGEYFSLLFTFSLCIVFLL